MPVTAKPPITIILPSLRNVLYPTVTSASQKQDDNGPLLLFTYDCHFAILPCHYLQRYSSSRSSDSQSAILDSNDLESSLKKPEEVRKMRNAWKKLHGSHGLFQWTSDG
eukprot:Gb_22615 [translate_table: standard]